MQAMSFDRDIDCGRTKPTLFTQQSQTSHSHPVFGQNHPLLALFDKILDLSFCAFVAVIF